MADHARGVARLPAELATGTELTSVVSIKGLRNRITWSISTFRPPESLTLAGNGVGGTTVSFRLSITPDGDGSRGGSHLGAAVSPRRSAGVHVSGVSWPGARR